MPSTTAYLPDDTEVEVDYAIRDGAPEVLAIYLDSATYGWDEMYAQVLDDTKDNHLVKNFKYITITEFVQRQLDKRIDSLIEEDDDMAVESASDWRAAR